jgi:hypothetical protein
MDILVINQDDDSPWTIARLKFGEDWIISKMMYNQVESKHIFILLNSDIRIRRVCFALI